MRRKILLTVVIVLSALSLFITINPSETYARSYRTKSSDVYVKGYRRKNGTYVKPHYKSKSDGIKSNNYSCIDNGRC